MEIILTGCAGDIGSNLMLSLLKEGHKVIGVDNFIRESPVFKKNMKHYAEFQDNYSCIQMDLCDLENVKNLDFPDKYLIHLAAYNGTVNFYKDPLSVFKNSLLPSLNLADVMQENKPLGILYTSTSEIYAGGIELDIVSTPTSEDVPAIINDVSNSRWSYAGAKLGGELIFNAFSSMTNVPTVVARVHNVYGPDFSTGHVISDLINNFKKGIFEVIGPSETRSFCHINDLNKMILNIISSTHDNIFEIYNLGNNEEINIGDLADMILLEQNIFKDIIEVPSREGSVKRRCPDISKYINKFGNPNFVNLKDGISDLLGET